MPRDSAFLDDIFQATKAIQRFTAGVSLPAFIANEEKYEAINRQFRIIGEAARGLSPEGRNALPEIPWRLTTAMRNIIVHDHDVDLNVIWDTVQKIISPLIERVETCLAAHPPPESDGSQSDV